MRGVESKREESLRRMEVALKGSGGWNRDADAWLAVQLHTVVYVALCL